MKSRKRGGAIRRFLSVGVVLLALVIGSIGVVPAQPASAVTCRNIVNPVEAYRFVENDYQVGVSYIQTVPPSSVSGCLHINVKNITQSNDPLYPNCAWFRVRFYPTSGGNPANDWQWRCSAPPNGPNMAIATDVLNGTQYRVEYKTRYQFPPLSYTIRD